MIAKGLDPIEEREAEKRRNQAAAALNIPFKQVCLDYIASVESTWKNPKHRQLSTPETKCIGMAE